MGLILKNTNGGLGRLRLSGGTGRMNVLAQVSSTPTVDPDAQAFITAAAITDPTQQSAVNTLVVSLKGYSIWTKMKALYPMIGGTAFSHKFNLKNPLDTDAAFRLVFNGGWVHSATGAKPNGTNGYADTFFSPSMYNALTDSSAGTYLRTNLASNTYVDMGQGYATVSYYGVIIYSRFGGDVYYSCCAGNTFNTGTNIDSRGFFTVTRTGTSQSFRKRGTSTINSTTTNTTDISGYTGTIFIGASNEQTTGTGKNPILYSARETAFAFMADYLSQSEIDNFYTAVQAFQTTLSRNV